MQNRDVEPNHTVPIIYFTPEFQLNGLLFDTQYVIKVLNGPFPAEFIMRLCPIVAPNGYSDDDDKCCKFSLRGNTSGMSLRRLLYEHRHYSIAYVTPLALLPLPLIVDEPVSETKTFCLLEQPLHSITVCNPQKYLQLCHHV